MSLEGKIDKMNYFRIGMACIVSEERILKAVFSDGDLRRTLINNQQTLSSFFIDDIIDYAIKDYKFVNESTTLLKAVNLMGELKIWDLPVVNSKLELKGLLHLHPAVLSLIN